MPVAATATRIISQFVMHLVFALRLMRRRPVTAAVVVLTLALGIAALTVMFFSFDAWVLRPLPFAEPDRLVFMHETQPQLGFFRESVSPVNLADWRDQQQVFERIDAFARRTFNLHAENEPERVSGAKISSGLFPLLGIDPVIGRHLSEAEDRPGGRAVVIIGHSLWTERFAGDPQVLGRTLRLNGNVHEIVGVMPAGFKFPEWAEVWTPLAIDPDDGSRDQRWLTVVARLAPGVSTDQATAHMEGIAQSLATLYPGTNRGWSVRLSTVREYFIPKVVRFALFQCMAAAVIVLLIIIANVSNLLLALASSRLRETAIRTAVGAGRLSIIGQFVTETTLLALLGGALGMLLGAWSLRWMYGRVPLDPPYIFALRFDLRVLLFAVCSSIAAGLLCGLAPVFRSARLRIIQALHGDGARGGGSPGGGRLRSLLVSIEFALSALLLVGALLVVASHAERQRLEPGFQTAGLVTMRLPLTATTNDDPQQRGEVMEELLDSISGLGSVDQAAILSRLPITRTGHDPSHIEAEHRPVERGEEVRSNLFSASPSFARCLELPILQGRIFSASEVHSGANVAVVSRSLAQELWPGNDAVGRRLRIVGLGEQPWLKVVGVVGDVDPGHSIVDEARRPRTQIWVPYHCWPAQLVSLVVRSELPIEALAPAVRHAVHRIDPRLPVFEQLTMDQVIHEVNWVSRMFSELFAAYALLALMIAALGAYGVTMDAAQQRTREMAIRCALGARPIDLVRHTVMHGLTPALAGIVLGLVVSLLGARLLSSMLYGVTAHDPLIFVGVGAVLAAIAAIASLIPARRVARIEPMGVLRGE